MGRVVIKTAACEQCRFFEFLEVELVILKDWIMEMTEYRESSLFCQLLILEGDMGCIGVYKVHLALCPVSKLANTRR